jgi:hypothetical protein
MTEVNKTQIAFIKDCFQHMNEGNFESLKEMGLSTIERLEKDIPQSDLYFSFPSDAEITKYVHVADTPENQDQFTHDTAFVKGAIWMREMINAILNPK